MSAEPRSPYVRPAPIGRVLLWVVGLWAFIAWGARCGGGAQAIPLWAVLLPLLLVPLVVNLGVMVPGLGMFARPILGVTRAHAKNRIALTFDDGPHPTETRRILDLLDQFGHKATFFIVGERAQHHPDVVREIVKRGHALANHSYHHKHSTPFLSPDDLAEELARVNQLIRDAQGKVTRWFRPPVGLISPRVRKGSELAGLELVGWSAKARDGWESTTVPSATKRLVKALEPGAILLLHDGTERATHHPIAASVLAELLREMQNRKLKSVTLDELLDTSALTSEPAPDDRAA